MNRRNLLLGAIISIALIAGVAYYGEITGHFRRGVTPPPGPTPAPTPFTLTPDPVEVEDPGTAKPVAKEDSVSLPDLPDVPQPPRPHEFNVPLQPPPVEFEHNLTKIPQGPRNVGPVAHVWDPGQLERQPVAKVRITPVYPGEMKRQGISGEVLVDFIVDPSGNVRNPAAVHSSQRDFEESACRAVGKWEFTPGIKGGRAVYTHMQVPIVFTLSDKN